jgi:hypothetical protein
MVLEAEVGYRVTGPQRLKYCKTAQHLLAEVLPYEEYAEYNQITIYADIISS